MVIIKIAAVEDAATITHCGIVENFRLGNCCVVFVKDTSA